MKKRILVSGGAGFIGSHLCERLLNQNHYVICVDNFFTGSKENILHLMSNPNFEVIRQDVIFPLYLEVDQIYHLACPASPKDYQNNPIHTIKTCVLGSLNMLGLAKRLKCPILQTSTSEVYGDPTEHPQRESYFGNVNPVGSRSCYDEGKRCAESLFINYHNEHFVDTKIARIFNTYGPRMAIDDGRVVSNFIVQALQDKPITIYGEGTQTRSFCYVDDMVTGLIDLLESSMYYYYPVNLGNPEEHNILDLANMIIKKTNSMSEIKYCKLPEDDPCRRKPDIRLAHELIEWIPKVELDGGLQRTIEYFRSKLNAS